jgi:hypothetical protein
MQLESNQPKDLLRASRERGLKLIEEKSEMTKEPSSDLPQSENNFFKELPPTNDNFEDYSDSS